MCVERLTADEISQFTNAIQGLKTRIGEYCFGRPVIDAMIPLKEFYERPQNPYTRQGIVLFINALKVTSEYERFLELQNSLLRINFTLLTDKPNFGPYTFFSFVLMAPALAVNLMDITGYLYAIWTENMYLAIEPLMKLGNFVTGSIEANEYGKLQLFSLLTKRISNYVSNYYIFAKQIETFWRDNQFLMEPTDGDLHCKGKNPYIVTFSRSNTKLVYKPRDMRVDFLVVQTLKFYNEHILGDSEFRLPIRDIFLDNIQDECGYMSFVEAEQRMDIIQGETYFKKLGALLCFCKLFGIKDLHYENIMASMDGPVLIDMECSFNQDVISDHTFEKMDIMYIKLAFNNSNNSNVIIYIDNKIPNFKEQIVKDNMLQGFIQSAELCMNNKTALIGYYQGILVQEYKIRIVPLATEEFYSAMVTYNSCADIQKLVIKEMVSIIVNNLNARFGEFFLHKIDRKMIGQLVATDFFNGDIPIIQLKNNPQGNGEIYMDNYLIMYLNPCYQDIQRRISDFGSQIDWLNNIEARALFEDFFK